MKAIARRRGTDEANLNKKVLTASAFLGKGGEVAYITPKVLLHFIDHNRPEDIKEMDSFIGLTNEGLKMAINRRINTDQGGLPYKYENFIRPKGPEGVKVILIGNIQQFIVDYQAGKFSIDFTLDDLVEEAEKP